MESLSETLASRPLTILSLLCASTLFAHRLLQAKTQSPSGLPWVGKDPEKWFSGLRSSIASFLNIYDLLAEGYSKYNKLGKSYMLPSVLDGHSVLLLPKSQWAWFLDQPDNVLSSSAFHYDTLGEDYCFTDRQILREAYHDHVIHKYLPRRLPAIISDLQDEVAVAFEDSWGSDTQEWKEVRLYDSVMVMLSRAVNRMIVGLPLCRNDEYLADCRRFSMVVIPAATMISATPEWLKPVVGRLVALPTRWYQRRMSPYLVPLITDRKAQYNKLKADPSTGIEMPNDFISWTILLADSEGRADESTVDRISRRVLPIEFASIHTTAISITHCLFDLISSDPSLNYLDSIRKESEQVLEKVNGEWTKPALAECHLADSALRESMRVSNFMPINSVKRVVSRNGITHPTEGWHAPRGTNIGFDMYSTQHDPELHSNASNYEAFRFAPKGANETHHAQNGDTKGNQQGARKASGVNTNVVTTSESWFPFSRGVHTCPGRFLIAAEIKMLLAYMTMNYEIEPLVKKPANLHVGPTILPHPDATIRVRRKSSKAQS